MSLTFTILGCGSSGGVPRIGNVWGDCDPDNPKNRRRRCSLLVERTEEGKDGGKATRILIDTSPDMRDQLLNAGAPSVDAVLYTHDHADHTHGIDDLRMIAINRRARVDVHMSRATADIVMSRFSYCFEAPEDSPYPPILRQHTLYAGKPVTVAGEAGAITALPFEQEHGHISSLGFRFGGLAYSCDVSGIPDASLDALKGLDVWIVDALRFRPHPSHFNVAEALEAIARVAPKRAVLTHMHVDLDYEQLSCELPKGVQPAFDGMVLETEE